MKPSVFVKNAVVGQMLLTDKTQDFFVGNQTSRIIDFIVESYRQTDRNYHTRSMLHDFEQAFFGLFDQIPRVKSIFATVARDAQFGQAQ